MSDIRAAIIRKHEIQGKHSDEPKAKPSLIQRFIDVCAHSPVVRHRTSIAPQPQIQPHGRW